ncbi:MAG: CPBP family intramembrane metalloprotease [Methanocalculaceae archaeon]|jgi:membrane protease YdiL (CAAX protease family)|nr:CPBP family intramembrane metalloprotease [Methanocalculaceae archaeon]
MDYQGQESWVGEKIGIVGILIGLFILDVIVEIPLAAAGMLEPSFSSQLIITGIGVIVGISSAALCILCLKKYHWADFHPVHLFREGNTAKTVGILAAGLGMLILANTIGFLLMYLVQHDIVLRNQELLIELMRAAPVMAAFLAIIAAPIFEEAIFRVGIFRLIKDANIAVVVSAILFGLFHVFGEALLLGFLLSLIAYALVGFVLAKIYQKYQSYTINVLVHVLINFVAVVEILPILG